MVNGLGYGLFSVAGEVYYNCNYRGTPFSLKAEIDDIVNTPDIITYYEEYDDDGNGVGEELSRKQNHYVIRDDDNSVWKIMKYFNENVVQ